MCQWKAAIDQKRATADYDYDYEHEHEQKTDVLGARYPAILARAGKIVHGVGEGLSGSIVHALPFAVRVVLVLVIVIDPLEPIDRLLKRACKRESLYGRTVDTKADIRQRLLERRRAFAPSDALRMSVSVRDRLWVLPMFHDARLVLTYVSAKDNEVDSRKIIARLLEDGRHVACPAIAPDNRLVWRRIESLACLIPGQYGIPVPDPERCRVVTPGSSCVALVPGIAFSRDGHRIGYGGGYFDRFLRDFPGTSIGLAYDFQIIAALPHGSHDMRVDFVLTESMTYEAAKQA